MASKTKSETTETKTADKEKAPSKLKTGWARPEELIIIGLDIKPGEPGYNVELEDPDRIKDPPSDVFVTSLIEHGFDGPVRVEEVKIEGKTRFVVVNGRQNTMGGREANKRLDDAHKMLIPWYIKPGGPATALDVTRANEYAKKDSSIQKARRAARLASLGYDDKKILAAFSDDGARAISKMTLHNWRTLLKCDPSIQEMIESGELPVSIGYELGKLPLADQSAALERIRAEGGKVTGVDGRMNARALAQGGLSSELGDDEGSDPDGGNGGKTRTRGNKLSAEAIKRLAEVFDEDEEAPYDDTDKKGKPCRPYKNGDFQALTGALLALITGDDPKGTRLKAFPSVFHHAKSVIRDRDD